MIEKEKEIWKNIEGYEGRYQISNWGRIKSLKRKGCRKDRILKNCKSGPKRCMYHGVLLYENNKRVAFKVHTLVALAFVKNPHPEKFNQVNHIKGNGFNNYYKNLEWTDNSGNQKHSVEVLGNKIKPVFSKDVKTKATQTYLSATHAARTLGIGQSCINKVLKSRQKSAGGYYWGYIMDQL